MEKGHLWMYQQIMSSHPATGFALAGPFSYNFILKHLAGLPDEMLFVITDPSILKIQKLQEYFRTDTPRILFLACDVHQLPVREKAVDLFIDDFSGINHAFTYNSENLYQTISPLLKDTGKAVGHVEVPRYNRETELAMIEARDIMSGKINARRYSSAKELFDALDAEE